MKEAVKLKPLISKEYTKTHLMNPEREYIDSLHTDLKARFKKMNRSIAAKQRKAERVK